MTTATAPAAITAVPADLPAYQRTWAKPLADPRLEAQNRYRLFMVALQDKDIKAWLTLDDLSWRDGEPADNQGQLNRRQAKEIAKLARRFQRDGDHRNADRAELALNAAGLLLDDVLPITIAQSIQADQEKRRIHELRDLLTLHPLYSRTSAPRPDPAG